MAKSESRLLSGRIKTKSGSNLDPRRSDFLSLENAEPNLGTPDSDRYVLASLADGTRVFLKLNNGFIVNADSVSGDETTFVIDPSGLANVTGTTLAQVLDNLDSAITDATLLGQTISDSNFDGLGTAVDPLRLDSSLNVFKLSADSISSSILTENRVVIVGPDGLLEDDGNLTYNGSTFTIANNTASTNSATGALVVTGGVGIGGALNVNGNTEINGNLSIIGTTTTVNAQTLSITDPLIHLADSNETSDEVDIGFLGHYFDSNLGGRQHTGLFRDATNDQYYLFAEYQDSLLDATPRSNTINRSDSSFKLAPFNAKSLTVDSEVTASTFIGNGAAITNINADNITTGDLPLGTRTSGNYVKSVIAGFGIETLGSASGGTQHTVTVDSSAVKGLFSGGANINYNSTSGEISVATSGVVSGTYGAANKIPIISVDSFGQVDSIGLVTPTTSLGDTVDSMSFNSLTGIITLTTDVASFPVQLGLAPFDTDSLSEGTTNLYYTTARVDSDILAKVDSAYVRARADSDYVKSVTGIDAGTLDGVNSTSFLRSDVADQKTTGNLRFNDNIKLTFGQFDDLQLYHDGTSSFISEVGTGDLYITTNGQEVLIKDSQSGKLSAEFIPDSAVDLYYNSSLKFATTDSGVLITGVMRADSGTLSGNRILTTVDEGSGNGLDADTLDGLQSTQFLRSDQDDSMAGTLFIDDSLSANNITRRNTTVTAGKYGSGSQIPIITVDGSGFVDSAGVVNVATALTITGETGSGTVNLLDSSFEIAAGEGVNTVIAGRTVTISGEDASTSNKGVASFNTNDFSISSGAVSIKTAGISNAQLENDSVTIGTTGIALGGSSTTLAGLTQLDIDNIRIDGNTISSTSSGNMFIDPHPEDSAGTLVILGDLQVNGTTTTINSVDLTIRDRNIILADSATNNPQADGAGITVGTYGSSPAITYDANTNRWDFNRSIEVDSVYANLVGNVTSSGTSTFSTVDINGGTIDGTAIGHTTADSATFTNLTANNLTIDTNTLFVDAANNRVGIGTDNTIKKLRVVDATDATTDFRTTNGTDRGFEIKVTSAASEVTIGSSTNHPLALMTNDTEADAHRRQRKRRYWHYFSCCYTRC